jgi:hypothetical protein
MKVNVRVQTPEQLNAEEIPAEVTKPRELTEDELAEVELGMALLSGRTSTVVMMKPDDLLVAPETQRRYRVKWGKQLANEFDVLRTGVLHANRRAGGDIYVLDGQHRKVAAQIRGYGDREILKVNLYEGLTPAEEAAMFKALNHARPVAATDLFLVGLTEGDQTAQGIARIFDDFGLTIGKIGDSRSFQAVKTAMRIYDLDPKALEVALGVVCGAWLVQDQTPPRGWLNGTIVEGVANMALHNGAKFNPNTMVMQLQGFGQGPWALLGQIRGRKSTQRGTSAEVAEIVLTELYNKSTRGRGALTVPERSKIEKVTFSDPE